MASTTGNSVKSVVLSSSTLANSVTLPDYDRRRLEEVGVLPPLTLVLLRNYS